MKNTRSGQTPKGSFLTVSKQFLIPKYSVCATGERLSSGQVRGEGAFLELDILLHVLGRHRPWEISRPSWPPVEVEAETLIFIYQKSEVHVVKKRMMPRCLRTQRDQSPDFSDSQCTCVRAVIHVFTLNTTSTFVVCTPKDGTRNHFLMYTSFTRSTCNCATKFLMDPTYQHISVFGNKMTYTFVGIQLCRLSEFA